MAIIERMGRIEDNFTMIPNDLARDPNLSMRAARVYIYVASHSTGWKTTIERVSEGAGMSKNTVSKAIGELVEMGWVRKDVVRDSDGRIAEHKYQVYTSRHAGYPDPKKPDLVKQEVDFTRCGENDLHKKTNSFKKTKASKKTIGARAKTRATPSLIADDWRPTDSQWQRHVENHPLIDHEAELRKFRIWNENNHKKRADWNRAFGNWLIRAKPERESWSQLLGVDYSEVEEVKPF